MLALQSSSGLVCQPHSSFIFWMFFSSFAVCFSCFAFADVLVLFMTENKSKKQLTEAADNVLFP